MTDGPIVWIDCEMTGLDAVNDALVEIAVIVTDAQLNPSTAASTSSLPRRRRRSRAWTTW